MNIKVPEDIDISTLSDEELEGYMTTQEILFCNYYLEAMGNGTEAWKRLKDYKCTDNVANVSAIKALRKTTSKEYIKRLRKKVADEIDIDYVIKASNRLFSECMKPRKIRVYDNESRKLIETGETYVDSKGAAAAIDNLNKALSYKSKETNEQDMTQQIEGASEIIFRVRKKETFTDPQDQETEKNDDE